MKEFYNIDKSGKVPVVNIRGIIGGGFFEAGVMEDQFIADVDALGDIDDLEVHISSKGGSVSVGLGIYNYLTRHAANIKTVVFSEASSIASVIALAGNERVMLEGTTMYVHEPLTGVQGYAADLFKTADYLVTTKNNILDIYERVTGQSRKSLEELMKNETMMNAQEALRRGFITAIEVPDTPVVNLMSNDDFSQLMKVEAENVIKDNRIAELEAEISAIKAEGDSESNEDEADGGALDSDSENDGTDGGLDEQEESAQAEQIASEIKAICAAAKVPEAAADYIAAKTGVEQVRKDLFDMLTTGDVEINSSTPTPTIKTENQPKTVNSHDIYAQRKQANKR